MSIASAPNPLSFFLPNFTGAFGERLLPFASSVHAIRGMVPVDLAARRQISRLLEPLLPMDFSADGDGVEIRSRYLCCYRDWRSYAVKFNVDDETKILMALISDRGDVIPLDGGDASLAAANRRIGIQLSRRDTAPYIAHYFRSVERNGEFSSPCHAPEDWDVAPKLPEAQRQRLEKMEFGSRFIGEELGIWRFQATFAGTACLYLRDFLLDPKGEVFVLGEEIFTANLPGTLAKPKIAKAKIPY